jgi:acyl phosphate:glycerol-3-phosphate acyltransferase
MPGPLAGIVLVLASFALGAVPWGFLAGKAAGGVDLRSVGSGGTGATNVLRTLGPRVSAVVLVLDFAKGVIPVVLAKSFDFAPAWVGVAAVAAVAGHCWSPFIGFKGGKGVATSAGAAVALFPPVLVVLPVMAAIVWVTRYVSLGSLVAVGLAALLAVGFALAGRLDFSAAIAIVAMAAIIFIRHDGNIRRLLSGTERRIGETVSVS